MPLINANRFNLNQNVGGLPDVSAAVMSLLQPTTVIIVTQQLINGYYKPVSQMFQTQASIQPLPQELAIKMEGERNWAWHLIHILPDVDLQNNDFITIFGKRYKVMKNEKWFQYGYIAYFVIEAFL
jgi:hypothetical protein